MRAAPRCVVIVACLLVSAAGPAHALKPPAVTIEGGGASTGLFTEPYVETHRIASPTGGVALDVHLNPRISIEPGLLFVRRGARLGDSQLTDSGGNVVGTFQTYLTADYTEIPVMMRFEPPNETPFKPFALIGASFGFKTDEQLVTHGALEETKSTSEFESFELGFAVGGGVEYGLGHHRLVVDLRYDAGATKHDAGNGVDFRSDVMMLMAGYVFHPEL
ncbi:MAG: porin family protein [Candidatus Eisenbacteria bacterium]